MNRATLVRAASPRSDAALMRRAAKIIGSHAYWMKKGCRDKWDDSLQAEYLKMTQTSKALRLRASAIADELREGAV